MFICASVRGDNEESELSAGEIVERLHTREVPESCRDPLIVSPPAISGMRAMTRR
jgi:hypothetical protein